MIDLKDKRFGNIKVIEYKGDKVYNCGHKEHLWLCQCQQCGKETIKTQSYIKSGRVSCRCSRSRHNRRKTKLYGVWQTMKNRCNNKNVKCYERYGGRGIKVCEEWQDFTKFQEWALKNGYKENEGLSIDRINNSDDYTPLNCRWVDNYTQANNKRNNHIVETKDGSYTLSQLERLTGLDHRLIGCRLKEGWDINDALSVKPIRGRNQNGKPPTTEDIIKKIKEIYGEQYDCSKVVYKNCDTPICLICKKHGEFWKKPYDIINRKRGCNLCRKEERLKLKITN